MGTEMPTPEIKKSLKEKYKHLANSEEYIPVTAFATAELNRQAKNIAAFLDGDSGENPDTNFGELYGIRYKGNSGNYTDCKIHIDDLDKFVSCINEYYA